MDAAITFFVSLVLLVAFIAFRLREEKRGEKVWADIRTRADVLVADMYKGAVMGSIPAHYREAVLRFFNRMAHDSVIFLVEGLRAIERPLARLSYRLRQRAPTPVRKDPSAFLKTIAPEKKSESIETTNKV